jgi:hypothetical protein
MTSFTYSPDRLPTPFSHCFTPSDLLPLLRARAVSSARTDLFKALTGQAGHSESEEGFPGLLFYLSADDTQAGVQLDAMSELLQELYLRSLARDAVSRAPGLHRGEGAG